MTPINSEDLVQYIYQETSPQKSAAIKLALETDWNLRQIYNTLIEGWKHLEVLNLSPKSKTMNAIFDKLEKTVSEFSV